MKKNKKVAVNGSMVNGDLKSVFDVSDEFTLSDLITKELDKEDCWAIRAKNFMLSFLRVAVYLRDHEEESGILSSEKIIKETSLLSLVKLIKNESVPEDIMNPLRNYVSGIPGMDENTLKTLQQGRQIQSQTVYEQHGYITSQLAKLHEIEAGLKNYYVDKKGVIFSFSRISSF